MQVLLDPIGHVQALRSDPEDDFWGGEEACINLEAAYPAQALQYHIAGVVRVEAAIDEHGNVKSAKAASGNQILTAAAVDAVKTWKYKAAMRNGQPVASTATIEVEFKPR